MAKKKVEQTHNKVIKNTCQNGSKTSTMNKSKRNSFKKYRGQGK